MVQNNSTDNYSTARFIVSATPGQGNYTTITLAMAAAVSGNTIFILPGTYTEDLTLKAGVDICAYDCDIVVPNVSIVGKCTFTGAGTVSLSGVSLNTNSDFCLVVSGSSASVVQLTNCFVRCTNNTGISYTSSGGGGIYLWYCNGNIATTAITLFSCSGSGTLQIVSGIFGNSGSSTTASTTSATFVNIKYAELDFPITTSSTGVVSLQWATLNGSLTNSTALTIGGGQSTAKYSYFLAGSATAIVANNQMQLENCVVVSSNTNAISGSNTLLYSNITFEGTSSTISSSTKTQLSNGLPFSVANGGTGVATMTTAYAPVCAGTTATGALQVASTGLSTSGYVLTSTGASSLPSFQAIPGGSGFTSVALQVFTASGTYTPTSGMVYCIIEVWGGGGAGGGSVGGGTTYVGLAGGAGGYSRGVYSSGTIGASTSVTIGAAGTGSSGAGGGTGGTTSVGSTLIQATGGTGGSAQSNPSPSVIYAGGAGGVGSLGTINLTGSPGLSLGYGYIGGAGGPTIFGPGAFAANPYANGVNAAAATAPTSSYGAGGSGSANGNGSTGSKAGSNGVAGIVIITEFLS